jgi:hypothetical protein
MRYFLFAIFFTLQAGFVFASEVVARFTPLADNERFAFSNRQERRGAGWQNILTIYAVRNNNIADISELFVWEEIRTQDLQFTGYDYRTLFFVGISQGMRLFRADGSSGEVRLVMDTIPGTFRVSSDGRFVGYINRYYLPSLEDGIRLIDWEQANIFVFDIENGITEQFFWRPQRPSFEGLYWRIFRFGDGFRIYGILQNGSIVAAAELNPATMVLTTLWDTPFEALDPILGIHALPNLFEDDEEWMDGVFSIHSDPSIRLR